MLSHCPGVLPAPHAPPHTACRWSAVVLPACRLRSNPFPISRQSPVVLSAYRDLSPLQGSYQALQETSTGRLSLAIGNITLHPTLHIMSKCCAWTESGPKNVPRPNRSDLGPGQSSTSACSSAFTNQNTALNTPNTICIFYNNQIRLGLVRNT